MDSVKILRSVILASILLGLVLGLCAGHKNETPLRLSAAPKPAIGRFQSVNEEIALDTATGRACYTRPFIHNSNVTIPLCSELLGGSSFNDRIIW